MAKTIMSSRLVLRQDIYLIGDVDTQIIDTKLPSKLQVLKVFFYNVRILRLQLRDSAAITIDEVIVFWRKAQLPIQRHDHCVERLLKLYDNWRVLQKHANKQFNRVKEQEFASSLENLFDIAHANVVQMVDKNKYDFLLDQRKDGRVGYIANIVSEYDETERKKKAEKLQRQRKKCGEESNRLDEVVQLASSSESYEINALSQQTTSHSNFSDDLNIESQGPKETRGTVHVLNDKLVAVLDRYKISDRNAVAIIANVAAALNVDVQSLIVNRSSIHRIREQIRGEKVKKIKEIFKNEQLDGSILHFDGKRLKNIEGENVERLSIVISCGQVEKILGTPELEDGTGKSQADVMFDVLNEWGLSNCIEAVCCDTTNSNLGHSKGAAVLLEELLEKKLLYLPCRHHIFEIVLRGVFELKIPSTSGPDVPLFKRFQQYWTKIDQSKYETGIEDAYVKEKLKNHTVDDIEKFVQNQLELLHPRGDYKELLQLVQVFIGKTPRDNVSLKKPGSFHHARWMAKAIYVLKIFLFRKQFEMTLKLKASIADICIFIVKVYVQAWFTSPLASKAPNNDLNLIKNLCNYKLINDKISQVALKKFSNHLWYLDAEAAAMAFFDEELMSNLKKRMVIMLKDIEEGKEHQKRLQVKNLESLSNLDMDSFISSKSNQFFKRFKIDTDFLKMHPSQWHTNESYKKGSLIVKNLRVVNDTAERAVKLMQEYHSILTKNPDQQQFTVQLVSEYQKIYADTRKCAIIDNLITSSDL